MNVSIIIPIYNVEQYIKECLRSVANQTTTKSIECILVDDCGGDNSVLVAEEFVKTYSGNIAFKLIHHEFNRGLSAARNTGIKAATGDYIFFLDSDDTITPDCIERMYSLATDYGYVDLVQGCYKANQIMLRDFHISKPEYSDDRSYIKRTMLDYDHFPIMAQNRLVKRSLIVNKDLYFKEGIIHEDNHWTFFLTKHICSLAICNKPTYFYRENPNGIIGQKNIVKEAKAFKTLIRDFSANIDEFEKGAQKRLILYNLLTLLNSGYYKDEQERLEMIDIFAAKNNCLENVLLRLYLKTKNKIILHLLERMYNTIH